MPTKPKKSNKSKQQEPVNVEVGTMYEEIEAPVASEVIFRKIWRIRKFHKTISHRDMIDSPEFRCSVNGMATFWNIAVRFWKAPHGKKVTNPLVICLNLTGCESEEIRQVRVRFQFGVWDASIRHWECCPISSVVLNLQHTQDLLSVGYKSLSILDRHIERSKDVRVMVKLQIIQNDEEVHSLSQDMARLMQNDAEKDTIVVCSDATSTDCQVHSWIVMARSPKLASYLSSYENSEKKQLKFKLDMNDYQSNVITELVRYIYTDKVDNADTLACKLLPLSVTYKLAGLTALCERALCESLTPNNVANILLIADQCGCEMLRKAALHYCEGSDEIKGNFHVGKTLAWRVMEMVNPDLFQEACENMGSSSSNLDSPVSSTD